VLSQRRIFFLDGGVPTDLFPEKYASDSMSTCGSVEDEKVMVEEANCYLLKVTTIKASLT